MRVFGKSRRKLDRGDSANPESLPCSSRLGRDLQQADRSIDLRLVKSEHTTAAHRSLYSYT